MDGPRPEKYADMAAWTADQLIDHVTSTHHSYERAAMPRIVRALAALAKAHRRTREVAEAAAAFGRLRNALERHLTKEEHLLFPYIHELAQASDSGPPRLSPFGTVENPIRMMEREHGEVLDAVRAIRKLLSASRARADAGRAECIENLARFEDDLQRHVQIEDHILFPKAIELEIGKWRADREP